MATKDRTPLDGPRPAGSIPRSTKPVTVVFRDGREEATPPPTTGGAPLGAVLVRDCFPSPSHSQMITPAEQGGTTAPFELISVSVRGSVGRWG